MCLLALLAFYLTPLLRLAADHQIAFNLDKCKLKKTGFMSATLCSCYMGAFNHVPSLHQYLAVLQELGFGLGLYIDALSAGLGTSGNDLYMGRSGRFFVLCCQSAQKEWTLGWPPLLDLEPLPELPE